MNPIIPFLCIVAILFAYNVGCRFLKWLENAPSQPWTIEAIREEAAREWEEDAA